MAKSNSPFPEGTRLPPHSVELERSILGAILIDPDGMLKVSDKLKVDDFYREEHRVIFEHMLNLFEKRKPIDLLTLNDALESSKKLTYVGGSTYIATLTSQVNSSVHISNHADIVRNKAMLRKLISAGSRIADLGYTEDGETDVVLDAAEAALFGVSQTYLTNNFVPIGAILSESFDRIDELHKNKGALRGVPTGYTDLDNLLGGLQKSDLVILAARPSMGKCVTGDTEIINPKTGETQPISELVKDKKGFVASLGANWKYKSCKPSYWLNDGVKPTFRVTTRLGHEIEATWPHPFLTVTGWKKLGELTVGDRIGVASELPYFGDQDMSEHEIKVLAYLIADGSVTSSCPGFTNDNPAIITEFSESVRQFGDVSIACHTSRGTRTPTYVVSVDEKTYRGKRKQWVQEFGHYLVGRSKSVRNRVMSIGLSSSNVDHWRNGVAQPSRVTFTSLLSVLPDIPTPSEFVNENPVTELLKRHDVWGKTAHQKSVPSAIFTLRKELVALFLNRLFACDGTAWVSHTNAGATLAAIAYSSVSKKLVYQVQHLLRRFGIVAKVHQKMVKYAGSRRLAYELEILGSEDIIRFAETIGIFGKEDALQRVVAEVKSRQTGWTKDTLPCEIWQQISAEKGNRSWRSVALAMGKPESHNFHAFKRNPRKDTVLQFAKLFNSSTLAQIALAPVFWDEIVSIESTGAKEVFDLTIPETHNFVANDFIVHNTSLALNIAENAAIKHGSKVAIFSLEQSKDQLVDRLLSSQAGVDSWKLRSGNLNDDDFPKLGQAMGVLSEASIFIDDMPGQTALELRTKSRRLQMEHGLDLIIIDYIQLMQGRNQENRQQEVSDISRALKGVARELNVPVVALSQLSRAVESRPDKRPLLSDLRESGSLEQDADVVLFIYRDDYYERDSEKKNIAEILVRKHRNGPVGEVDLYFQSEQTRFRNLDKRGH